MMAIKEDIICYQEEMVKWRKDFHAHPEIAFKEFRTSKIVADYLEKFGIEVHRGIAKTGVIGRLKVGNGNRAIALRADMDALPLEENNIFDHRSEVSGMMHACGHDGHTTMLLGAAKYLAKKKSFDGTVYFIFQPAEEGEGGAKVMVDEGLFDKFPAENVFGLHNWPGMPVGKFGIAAGPMMAAFDIFDIIITGLGGHGAMPHQVIDPIVASSQLILALQTIASRNIDPLESIVLSVTKINAGDAYNIIPHSVQISGTVRSFKDSVRDKIEPSIMRISKGICEALGATVELDYKRCYPPTINYAEETELAALAAESIVGKENIDRHPKPSMGSEDFAYMLRERPGCYVWLGNGDAADGCMLHNPGYDFNDDILSIGASYWAALVEQILPIEV